MIYLASPYSHPDPLVMQQRFEIAERVTACFLRWRKWTYSPIVHCHELSKKYNLPHDFNFWKDYNFSMLRFANGFYIVGSKGWQGSVGVQAELAFARELGLPLMLVDISTDEFWSDPIL